MISLIGSFLAAPGPPAEAESPEKLLYSFATGQLPDTLVQHNVSVKLIPQGPGNVLEVRFQRTDWPNVFFRPLQGTWDWSAYAGLAVDLYNPEANSIQACVRIDNEGADGLQNCNTGSISAPLGQWITFRQYFHTGGAQPFWGMRGLPRRGLIASGPTIDPTRITAFQILLPRPDQEHTLQIGPIRLFGVGGELRQLVPLPFVASGSVQGDFRCIEGAGGYWAPMIDVYDPKFAQAAGRCLEGVAQQCGSNPLCLGYFVDNKMAWEAIERGTLNSPPGQPCRRAFVEILQKKYGTLEKLNEAWGATAASWDALRVPADIPPDCRQDLDDFVYTFARRYFETVRATLRRHAPHQLYLGCRFASRPPQVVRACADVADVVSFNLYTRTINPADWTDPNDLGKPILIGEFHFGALDRGMFHTGLVGTANQQERAEAYVGYVRSVADCPNFVGCHWFQYIDEPLTGRWFDGENYNIGFVDVTDTPSPELVEAAKKGHREIYSRHWEGPTVGAGEPPL